MTLYRNSRTLPVLLAVLLLCAGSLFGQSLAGLGAMGGTVLDPQGAVIQGAVVTVSNPSIGIDRKITANSDGYFFAPSLPPAAGYTVSVQVPGFSAYTATAIMLHVGESVTVPVQLSLSNAATTVDVSASSELINTTQSGVSGLVNSTQIAELPINGRRVDQFVLLTAGVVQDGTSGEVSFHGVPAGNLFLQDGVDITQQWFVGNAGGSAVLSNISQDSVQEFRVETSGYAAEFGRSAGGVVNTLTKSGTNAFHGTGYEFFRNRTLNAIDLFSKLNGVAYNPPEYRHQFGAAVGAPIVKDKLFFFTNYEGTRRHFPLTSSIINPAILVTGDPNHAFVAGACNATAAQCAAAQAYFARFFRVVNRSLTQNDAFLKFDYRPNDKSSFTANFNLLNYAAPDGLVSSIAPTDGSGLGGNGNVSTHIRNGRLSYTYILSNSMVNEFRFGYNKDRRAAGLDTALSPPNGLLSALSVAGQGNLGITGNALPYIQPTEDRFDLVDSFSQTKGKHQLKYGFDVAYTRDVENGIFQGPGSYNYGTVTAFAQDLTPNAADPGTPGKRWTSFQQAIGHPLTKIFIRDYDIFAQDQWQATRRLSVNYGVRYEYVQFAQPPLNPDYPQTGRINEPTKNFAPRVGLAYAMNSNKTVIRANYGLFYNRLPGASVMRLQQLGGVVRKSVILSSSNATQLAVGPSFPNRLDAIPTVAGLTIPVNTGFGKTDLATPYTQQANFGVEQQLGGKTSISATYIFSRGVKFLQRSDLNIGPAVCCDTYNITNAAGASTGTFSTPVYKLANRIDPRYVKVLQIDNSGRIYYDGLALEMKQRTSTWLQSTVAYTWSHARDNGQGSASGNNNWYFTDQPSTFYNGISTINGKSGYAFERGRSLLDQRHRVVVTAVATLPHRSFGTKFVGEAVNGWQLAPIFTAATAQGVNPTMSGSGDPAAANSGVPISGLGSEQPGGTRVPFLATASLPLGNIVRMDARLSKTFPLPREMSFTLGFEAANVFNHISYTSVSQTAYASTWSTATGSGTIKASSGTGTGTASGGFPDGTNARRAQVVARFNF